MCLMQVQCVREYIFMLHMLTICVYYQCILLLLCLKCTAGIVSTFAGGGSAGLVDGTVSAAMFNYPSGVAVNTSGTVYVADRNNHLVRTISPSGYLVQ